MASMNNSELLKIPEVVEEIKRHLWCESEKAGHDVGYQWAQEDWLSRYSKSWVEYHKPNMTPKAKSKTDAKKRPAAKKTTVKKRRAKSYC